MCVHLPPHCTQQVSAALSPLLAKDDLSPIEQLPNEILAKIAQYLSSGSRDDPLIALQAIQNLVQSSKRMYRVFNAFYITGVFLRALAKKYGEKTEEYAARLSTLGARYFMQHYIQKNRLDETYAITEQLECLTFQVFEQAKNTFSGKEPSRLHYKSRRAHDHPNSIVSELQTAKGFLMYVDWVSLKVAHPFGIISIYNLDFYKFFHSTWIFSIARVLLHRLKGTFRGRFDISRGCITPIQNLDYPQWIISTPMDSKSLEKISKITIKEIEKVDPRNLEKRLHQHILIVDLTSPHTSCYDLHYISRKRLPVPELKTSPKRSHKLMKTIVSVLESKNQDIGAFTVDQVLGQNSAS